MVSFKGRMWIGFRSRIPGIALLLMVTFVGLASAASAFASNTYYVSKSAGSDANAGTSKSAPWAHIPGMASCTGSTHCGTYSPAPGDTFILMGCDVWTNSDLPVLWNWSGSSGSPITIGGEDKTWYNTTNCPSAWNRPVWNAGGAGLSPNVIFRAANSGNTAYGVLDNIEMKGMYCQASNSANPYYCGDATHSAAIDHIQCFEGCTNWTFSNNYLHGWSTTELQEEDNCTMFHGSSSMAGTVFTQNVIDGSDATTTCYGMYPSWPPVISNNVMHDLPNGLVGSAGSGNSSVISGNQIYNILQGISAHANALESTGTGTHYFYNNVIHDLAAGEALMIGNTNEVDYIWNNLWYNITGTPCNLSSCAGSMPEAPQDAGYTNMSIYAWNNTIVNGSGGGTPCFLSDSFSGTFAVVTIENTHCISSASIAASTSWGSVSPITPTLNNNVLMSPSTATSQGYTSSETYAYSPTAGTNGTVGKGKTICSVEKTCTGNFAALANDTNYACSQQTVNGVVQVVCPSRTVVPRQGSAGAYEYASSGSAPTAPTGLTAVVH